MSAVKKKNQSFLNELFRVGLYKKNQGRLTRQLSALGLLMILAHGLWTLAKGPLASLDDPAIRVGVPLALFAIGAWVIYRVVNYPRFADFLISVEAEMDKVSWPSRGELYRATIVVVTVMVVMAGLLFVYDQFWIWAFRLIGFLVDPADIPPPEV